MFLISWCFCSAPVFLLSMHTLRYPLCESAPKTKNMNNMKLKNFTTTTTIALLLAVSVVSLARALSLCIRVGPCCVLGFSHYAQLNPTMNYYYYYYYFLSIENMNLIESDANVLYKMPTTHSLSSRPKFCTHKLNIHSQYMENWETILKHNIHLCTTGILAHDVHVCWSKMNGTQEKKL